MRIDIITIFPGYVAPLSESLIGKAVADGVIQLAVHNLRDWTEDNHHTVDDSPYGGGPGMVMRADIWGEAIDSVAQAPPGAPVLVIPTPSGAPFTQATADELAGAQHLIFACGRYEGIDGRFALEAAQRMTVRELSIGDYVLAGGEVAALVMVEAIGRLLPGVLGNTESALDDSFSAGAGGLLEGPVYTRPPEYRGLTVPDVLLSGHHSRVARHRRDESLRRTAYFRPELLANLTADDCDERDLEVLLDVAAQPPAGLAERIAAERQAREAKMRRRRGTS